MRARHTLILTSKWPHFKLIFSESLYLSHSFRRGPSPALPFTLPITLPLRRTLCHKQVLLAVVERWRFRHLLIWASKWPHLKLIFSAHLHTVPTNRFILPGTSSCPSLSPFHSQSTSVVLIPSLGRFNLIPSSSFADLGLKMTAFQAVFFWKSLSIPFISPGTFPCPSLYPSPSPPPPANPVPQTGTACRCWRLTFSSFADLGLKMTAFQADFFCTPPKGPYQSIHFAGDLFRPFPLPFPIHISPLQSKSWSF
jgi:hypothetical protein